MTKPDSAVQSIEEAARQLDTAVRAVRRLPWGESPSETAQVLAEYEAKKRALALAVLDDVLQLWGGTLSKEGAVKLMEYRAQIEALGD